MRRLPPVGSMQAFVEVARHGSLKAAADALALSSPALTRRIQSLEQFVGHPLFDRQRNGLQLNARGTSFYAEIAPHIDAMAHAVERISGPGSEMRIRVAAPSLFASQRLMPALSSLQAEHPGLTIEVDTGGNRLARLGEDLDAVIAIASEVDSKHYSRLLEQGRVVGVGSRSLFADGDRPAPDQLRNMPILLHRDMPGAFDHWCSELGLAALTPASVHYYDAGQLVLDAAAAGMGVAFMHESHVRHSMDPRLVQLFEHTVDSPYAYWFVCAPDALRRRPVRLFHDWLFEWFAGHPAGEGATGVRHG
jgi:LysR family glycine cleavage system transcriptional activator